MLVHMKSKELFLQFVNHEAKENNNLYYSVKDSGMTFTGEYPEKRFTLLFISDPRTYVYTETISKEDSDQYLNLINQKLNQFFSFQELNTIQIDNGTLVLK